MKQEIGVLEGTEAGVELMHGGGGGVTIGDHRIKYRNVAD